MKLGVLVPPFNTDDLIEDAKIAEEYGFDFLGVPDSQCLMQELHTNLGALAREVNDLEIGSSVTNPMTRHPAVTASAFATINGMTGGNTVLGVGGGDSAVYTLGEEPANLDELEAFIRFCKRLTQGKEVEYNGEPIKITWEDRAELMEVPVLLSASGPKTLKLGGRVADRVLIGSGITPEVVEGAVELINEGAEEAGRDPDNVEKWIWPIVLITEDPGYFRDMIQELVAGAGHLTFQFTFEGKQVPDEHREALKTLVEEYDSTAHMGLGEKPENGQLVEELGLTDYLAERFCAIGTPEECREKLDKVDHLVDGAHCVAVNSMEEFAEAFGETVIPALS